MTEITTLLDRLLAADAGLWPEGNVAPSSLGWLEVPRRMRNEADDISGWASTIDASTVVLLGMGGSSLGPEVLRAAMGSDRLVVLDTTEPRTVASVDLDDAFFLVSSKSGTTFEVKALLAYCWERVGDPSRYAAITDPDTPLAELAEDVGFNRLFLNPADIGGRYSVLSYFGLVPAALCGLDIAALCQSAIDADAEEAVKLGLEMGEAAVEGRDKVTVVVPERYAAFGLWVEQLIAESTGKHGKGCIPVPTTEPETGHDRHLVTLEIDDPIELGREFLRWELATASAGHVLGIDPFDQPDVAESKANVAKVLKDLPLPDVVTHDPATVSEWVGERCRPGDYLSIQAYLPYGQDDALGRVRRSLRDKLGGMAVTVGYGPRFLHSTGQLHKGGPNTVLAVQVVPRSSAPSVPIPWFKYDFNTMVAGQALGDYSTLHNHERRVQRVAVDDIEQLG
ncbi:MAG: glucose-6-phosphate isomerase [Actinomycetota bacterium]|nr:glucose-6-phosphate isomerase [Actinomycetota bacterium]MDQ3574493.1 glucose-6-phosphate isomerase [Actinomycetota bacterium]